MSAPKARCDGCVAAVYYLSEIASANQAAPWWQATLAEVVAVDFMLT